jgi:hypothetical protein
VSAAEPEVRAGFVAPAVAAEFPDLRVAWTEVPTAGGPSPPAVRERLRALSDRVRGADAIALRGRDVPHAYRVFFRHVGLDPDIVRVPVEALMVERLVHGGYPSRGRLPDALSIACIETGVPVWAFDADRLEGLPSIRSALAGETIEDVPVPAGRLVLADAGPDRLLTAAGADRLLAVLFEPPGPSSAPGRATQRLALVSVVVPGVPALFAEEALWIASEALGA